MAGAFDRAGIKAADRAVAPAIPAKVEPLAMSLTAHGGSLSFKGSA